MSFGVTVDINARTANLTQQINQANRQIQGFVSSVNGVLGTLGAVGAVVGAAGIFSSIVKSSIDAADNLNDLSKSTGLAVEQLAGLNLAAKQSGTDLESVGQAVNKLSVNIAKDGDKFKQLGISAKDPLEAFAQLADVFAAIQDPQQRAAVGSEALGKAWATAAPLLSEGGDAIRKMVEEGKKASGITTQMAKDADALNDQISVLSLQFQGLVNKGVAPLVPQISTLLEYMSGLGSTSRTASNEISVLGIAFNGIAKFVAAFADIVNRAGLGIGALVAKAQALATLDFSGFSAIDKAFSEDISAASKRYDDFVKKLDNPVVANVKIDDGTKKTAPSQESISNFIGTPPKTKPVKLTRVRVPRAARVSLPKAAKQDNGESVVSQLQRELALIGDTSRAAAAKYDTQKGSLAKISESQKALIVSLNTEIDAYKRQQGQWDQLVEDANAFYDLKKNISELSINADINLDSFNSGLAQIQDALKNGVIDETQAKEQFDILGKGFNENFVNQAIDGTNKLNDFAEQAARNIQDSFAQFLFDPFKDGIDGMLVGFLNFIRQAAAEAAASQLLDALKPAAREGAKAAGSFISSFFHGGGMVGGAAIQASVNPLVFAGAPRFHNGGYPGLKSDEVPAILQTGELVLSRNDVQKLSGSKQGGGSQSIVINNSFIIGNDTSRQSQQQIAASAGRGIQAALLRTR